MTTGFKCSMLLAIMLFFTTACSIASPTAALKEQLTSSPVFPGVELTPTSPLTTPEQNAVPTTAQPAVTSQPPLGGSGVLIFGSNRDGAYMNIYQLDTNAQSIKRLTTSESNTFPGPFSPDGTKLLFTGFGLTNSFIGIMNADGSDQVDLSGRSKVDEGFPAWSPDGKQIAFTSRMDGNNEIYLMNPDGSGIKRITNNPSDDFAPAWSPDGSKIAFVSDRDNPAGVNNLYLMSVDGSDVVRLTATDELDYGPVWSPDGKQIAFRADIDSNSDIYVINSDGSGRINLTKNSASDWAPAWSPDGKLIAFQTNRDGNWEIYVMHTDGSEPTNLTSDPHDDQMPYWKPSGVQ